MKIKFTAVVILFLPFLAWPQTTQSTYEAAKLRVIEMIYESGSEAFEELLANRGHSNDEIESILFEAFDAFATCLADAARVQAQDQKIKEEILLNALGNKSQNENSFVAGFYTDLEAYGRKQEPCSAVLYEKLGLNE